MKKDCKNILLIVLFVLVLGVSINVFAVDAADECSKVVNEEILNVLNDYVYVPIKWATPILLLLLTSIDFSKVVFTGKKEDMDKVKSNFMKRFVAALIVFFAPDVIILIVNLTQQYKVNECLNSFK